MKKTICLILVTVFLLSFPSCSDNKKTDIENFTIMTTIFPFYSFVKAITADVDNVDVKMLIQPGAEVHTYSPDAEDVYNYINSDIFICIGGESDEWTENLIKQSDKVKCIKLLECIDIIEEKEDSEQNHNHKADEHIWVSPKNAEKIVMKICDEVCATDKTNESIYRKNTENYIESLKDIDEMFMMVSGNTIICEGIFPFGYLARDYSLNYFSGLDGCDGTTDISAQKLDFLVNSIRDNNVKTIFFTEFSDKKIANKLCSITNADKKLLHSCHNVTLEEFENGETYLTLMEKNAKTLLEVFDIM